MFRCVFFFYLILSLLTGAEEVARVKLLRVPLGGGVLVTDPSGLEPFVQKPRVLGVSVGDGEVRSVELEHRGMSDWIEVSELPQVLQLWQHGQRWKRFKCSQAGDSMILLLEESQGAQSAVRIPVAKGTLAVNLSEERLRLKLGAMWHELGANSLSSLKTQGASSTLHVTLECWRDSQWKPGWMRAFTARKGTQTCLIFYQEHGMLECKVLSF